VCSMVKIQISLSGLIWVFIAGIPLVLGLSGCGARPGAVQDKALADHFNNLYELQPPDSPARFALNQIADRQSWRSFHILTGDWPSTPEQRKQARSHLNRLKADIDIGMKWPVKSREQYNIPYARVKPGIDGNINEPAWTQALIFEGEFAWNGLDKKESGAIWKIMWDEQYLYIGAHFPDTSLTAIDNIPGKSAPWDGDVMEIFIRPSLRMRHYWEVVINPAGTVYDGLNINNKWGNFIVDAEENIKGLKIAVKASGSVHNAGDTDQGYSVEVAFPFAEMPNYMLGNPPRPGETIFFMLVRFDCDSTGARRFYAVRPLLYGGHNIFGYLMGTLVKIN